jgi:hypothetical protein
MSAYGCLQYRAQNATVSAAAASEKPIADNFGVMFYRFVKN